MNSVLTGVKKELRREIRKQTAELDRLYIEESNNGICANFLKLPEVRGASRFLLYASARTEVSTFEILSALRERGAETAFPVCLGNGIMHFKLLNPSDSLVKGMYGIGEPPSNSVLITPETGDVIVVPALAFSKMGFRLGMGGGYYDRFLSSYPFLCSVGLARERLLLDDVPAEDHDMRVRALVSESGVLRFDA